MTIGRFLEAVHRHGWVTQPLAAWRAEVVPEAMALLRRDGWLVSEALAPEDSYPCPSPGGVGCPRRVVELSGQLVAVCGREIEDCDDVVVPCDEAEVLGATPRAVRRALGRALRLDQVEEGDPGVCAVLRLGERRFGEERAAFYFAHRLGRQLGDWVDATVARERGRAVALVVPRAACVGRERGEMLGRSRVSLLPLDRVLRADAAGTHVDLAAFVLEHRFAGVDPGQVLWPRYRLVMDPEGDRYWISGRRLALDGKPKSAAMLRALARSPGRLVTRGELCREVWPESYGGRGTLEIDWDRRIRGLKRELGKVLEATEAGAGAILQAVSGDETVGGYRLAIQQRVVKWWSR